MTDSLAPGVVTLANFDVLPVSPAATPDCQDGIDNDDDGRIDFTPPVGGTADPDCVSAQDNSEFADLQPECADGFDNDFDGLVDFTPPAGEAADPGCASASDNQEVEGQPDPTPRAPTAWMTTSTASSTSSRRPARQGSRLHLGVGPRRELGGLAARGGHESRRDLDAAARRLPHQRDQLCRHELGRHDVRR